MERTDQELLETARGGDRDALELVLSRHQPRIYRFGLKLCRDQEDAKDVLQDTMLAVARGLKDFRGQSAVSTWLYTIARSFCIKKRRRSKFAPEAEESLDAREPGEEALTLPDPGRPPDEALAGRQIEDALERAIGGLEPMYRDVLVLRDVEGLTAPEVGEVMGLSVEAVKSRLHRARVAVRDAVAPILGYPSKPPPRDEEGCPDIVRMFSQHIEGEISAPLCARMEEHLAACPSCRGRCESLQKTLALCRATPVPELPAGVQADVRTALRRFVELHT